MKSQDTITIETVKQNLLTSIDGAAPDFTEPLARAYKTLCEAEQVEGETAFQKVNMRDYCSWVEFRDMTNNLSREQRDELQREEANVKSESL